MAAVTTYVALGAQILAFVSVMAAATVGMIAKLALDGPAMVAKAAGVVADWAEAASSVANTGAKISEAAASIGVTIALGPLALAALAVAAVFVILAAAVLVLVGVFVGTFLKSLYDSAVAAKAFEQAVTKANARADEEKDKLSDVTGSSGVASESKFVTGRGEAASAEFNKVMINATKFKRATAEASSACSLSDSWSVWSRGCRSSRRCINDS